MFRVNEQWISRNALRIRAFFLQSSHIRGGPVGILRAVTQTAIRLAILKIVRLVRPEIHESSPFPTIPRVDWSTATSKPARPSSVAANAALGAVNCDRPTRNSPAPPPTRSRSAGFFHALSPSEQPAPTDSVLATPGVHRTDTLQSRISFV